MSNFRCDAALEHQTYVIFMYVCLSTCVCLWTKLKWTRIKFLDIRMHFTTIHDNPNLSSSTYTEPWQCLLEYSPHIPNPAGEVVWPVPHGDQGVGAEEDCLRPVCRLGELGEHYPRHAGLEHRIVRGRDNSTTFQAKTIFLWLSWQPR